MSDIVLGTKQVPVIYTKSGHALIIASQPNKPMATDEWLKRIEEWRINNNVIFEQKREYPKAKGDTMNTGTMEKTVVKTKNGQTLAIAQGTEPTVSYGDMLSFWEGVWSETEKLRPDYSMVEDFLIDKRIEVERENRELDA